ncbi:MAG: hypothetical protein ABTR54_07820 [Candidatus Competibacter sp.]
MVVIAKPRSGDKSGGQESDFACSRRVPAVDAAFSFLILRVDRRFPITFERPVASPGARSGGTRRRRPSDVKKPVAFSGGASKMA